MIKPLRRNRTRLDVLANGKSRMVRRIDVEREP
jgi:hypothetical protein